MKRDKKKFSNTRQDFLLTFFSKEDKYEQKEINGFILCKFHDNNNHKWEVAIYTRENWDKVINWKQQKKLNQAELL